MKPFNRWFGKISLPDPLRPERRQSPGLCAYHSTGSTPKQDDVRDISCTGVYIFTEERWIPGTLVSLTLQRKGPPQESSDHRITLQAKAVRWGNDGVGLSFALPANLDRSLWESLLACTPDEVEPEDVLKEFRMAEALAFLSRICPPAAKDVRSLLCGGLSNYRALSAVKIALKAEELFASGPDADKMRAPSSLVVRILEDGSWADEEWILHLWAGLLATSCTKDENDEPNHSFVDLFSQLAATHVHVLGVACKGATKVISEDGSVSAQPLVCAREEIIKITGWHDLSRIERDLEHMTDLGLLERCVKSSSFAPLEEAHITPSSLALQLYARCNGHRGAPGDFYSAVSPGVPSFVIGNP